MEKNIQKIKIKNQLELWAFCAVIGTVAGALVWALLKIMASGTEMIWEWIPEKIHIPYYTVLVCTVGGAIIGIFRKLYGDYPEDMETVMGKVKKEKRYEYKNMLVMMIAALLPLLIGSSVGPEAGLTGIIVGLCYWAGENLKFAKQHTKEYSQIGAAGTGSYAGLSALLGGGMSGFPSFDAVAVQRIDYVMMLVYMFCGCVLAYFYETTHTVTGIIAGKIPGVVKEILAGLCLGVIGMLIPAVMFSGEEQMGVLMKEYAGYMAIALIGAAFLKIILTNLCIQFGLKGGHFFPVIFAGVCLGYGLAMLFFGQQGDSHVVFAAAIVTSTLLGGIMKKPLAVTMLLFLCFPVKIFIWIFIAAAVGSKCVKKMGKEV